MKELVITKNILNENSELLQDFFRDVNKYPMYTGEEQIELAKKMKAGDKDAREKLITSNLKFVVTCAKQYTGQGVPLMDLIQSGFVGLLLSLDNYDPDKGYKFLSYAVWYIRREIIKAIYDTGRTIRYPTTYISRITKVKKAYDEFVTTNQREPTDEELIHLANVTQKQYSSVLLNKSYCQSIDTPINNDEKLTVQDILASEENECENTFIKDTIADCLKILTDREYKVITEYYGLNGQPNKEIYEIANEMCLGEERIRQLRKSGVKKLKQRKGNILKSLL